MLSFDQFITESENDRIERSTFLYMPPKGDGAQFAQCSTCSSFLSKKQRCRFFGKRDQVIANASCGLYTKGEPNDFQPVMGSVTPEQAGYVEQQVRCENCSWFDGRSTCGLFDQLNKTLPRVFDLDTNVEPKGCCNGWQK